MKLWNLHLSSLTHILYQVWLTHPMIEPPCSILNENENRKERVTAPNYTIKSVWVDFAKGYQTQSSGVSTQDSSNKAILIKDLAQQLDMVSDHIIDHMSGVNILPTYANPLSIFVVDFNVCFGEKHHYTVLCVYWRSSNPKFAFLSNHYTS